MVVDTSFFMEAKEPEVRRELDRIDDRDRSEFALATARDRGGDALVHDWQDELTLGGFQAFGPCSFDGIDQLPEASTADERILITTSTLCDTSALTDWTIDDPRPDWSRGRVARCNPDDWWGEPAGTDCPTRPRTAAPEYAHEGDAGLDWIRPRACALTAGGGGRWCPPGP